MRRLLLTILDHSTAMPFRRDGNIFRCFTCPSRFHLASALREHFRDHDNASLFRSAKRCEIRYSVKLDIADLKCKRCDTEFAGLEEFLTHLNTDHEENCCIEDQKYLDCFKLSDDTLKCLVCNEDFTFFGPLLLHTWRVHKKSQFICEICGLNFANKTSIKKHTLSAHATESFKCTYCEKKFFAKHRRDDHEQRIHDVKKRKCHICGEILGSTYKKDSHLASVHNYMASEFKCEICSKVFRFQNQLVKHKRRVHLKEKTKVCQVCGDMFFDNHLLSLHMVRHSDAKPFQCGVCNKKFPRKRALDIHTRIHTNDKRCVCKLCGKAFVQTGSLKLHLRVHQDVDEAIDQECRKKEDLIKLLTVIIENSTVIPFKWHANKYMCFFCCCPFEDSSKLKQHTKVEHEEARLKTVLKSTVGKSRSIKLDVSELTCKKCEQPFRNIDEFLRHISDEHGFDIDLEATATHCIYSFILTDSDMICLECGMAFRFFGPLIVHTHKYHSKTKLFLCEVCGQGFIARANVESHRKNAHPAICGFNCKECNQNFSTQYKLTYHFEKVHSPAKMKCPKCPEILASKYLKKRHLAFVHDVESAQFKCDECPKIFSLKNKLIQHKQRVHLKEKNFACEICGFKVFSKDLLKRHMVKHDDSRPFECDLCKKAFQRKKTLDFHRRIHTNDKRYQCKECGRAFVQWTSLKLHLRVHHTSATDTWT